MQRSRVSRHRWSIPSIGILLLFGCGARTLTDEVDGTAGCAGQCANSAGSAGRAGSAGAGARAGSGGGNGGTTSPGGTSGSGGRGGTGGSFSGTKTVTLETDSFVVNPGQELFRCQTFQNPFGTDVDVLKTESHMPSGSHHLGVFFESGATDGALYPCSGLQFSAPLHQAQRPDLVREYPEGLGMRMGGDEGLRFVMHYLNVTGVPITAQVRLTITAASAGTVKQQVGVLFFNTLAVNVPAHSPGTATGHCSMPADVNLLEINSHMHMHATHVIAKTGSGLVLFENDDWSDPLPRNFSPPLPLGNDTEISWTCTYQNNTDQPLSFGESAATNEMCIIAGTFFPALDERTHACLF